MLKIWKLENLGAFPKTIGFKDKKTSLRQTPELVQVKRDQAMESLIGCICSY